MSVKFFAASRKPQISLVFGFLTAIGVTPLLSAPAFSQVCTGAEALRTNCQQQQNSNEVDALTGAGNGQLNMLDLLMRAQLGSISNMDDFTAEQRQNLRTEADSFLNQQLERLQQAQPIPQAQPQGMPVPQ